MRILGGRGRQQDDREQPRGLPQPSTAFRRRAWLQFQRALDPLARPKPFRIERH